MFSKAFFVVMQTNYGDIEFGFFPSVAPKTVDHIFKLVRLGCYNTNHFFRVRVEPEKRMYLVVKSVDQCDFVMWLRILFFLFKFFAG